MKEELQYGIPIVVLIALITVIASDYCRPVSLPEKIATITLPAQFNPLCYIASFSPDAPEFYKYRPILQYSNSFSVTASGTNNSNVSTSVSPLSPAHDKLG